MLRLFKFPIIKFLLIGSIGLSLLYTKNIFFDFVLSLFYYMKLNIPSLAYTTLRSTVLLTPLILMTIASRFGRVNCLKVIYVILGICYLLGNTWIIYFFATGNNFDALFDLTALVLAQRNDAWVLNYLMWNCFTPWSLLFSTIQGVLYLILARKITERRKPALTIYGIILLLEIFLPLAYSLYDPMHEYIGWLRENIHFILSQILIYIAMLLAGANRDDWYVFAYEY